MSRKLVLFSVVAVVVLVGFMVASAVAVFAFVAGDAPQVEVAPAPEVLEAAPVQVEVSPTFVEPVIEQASYQDYSGGCPYSHSKVQLTQAPAKETLEDAPLAQLNVK